MNIKTRICAAAAIGGLTILTATNAGAAFTAAVVAAYGQSFSNAPSHWTNSSYGSLVHNSAGTDTMEFYIPVTPPSSSGGSASSFISGTGGDYGEAPPVTINCISVDQFASDVASSGAEAPEVAFSDGTWVGSTTSVSMVNGATLYTEVKATGTIAIMQVGAGWN